MKNKELIQVALKYGKPHSTVTKKIKIKTK